MISPCRKALTKAQSPITADSSNSRRTAISKFLRWAPWYATAHQFNKEYPRPSTIKSRSKLVRFGVTPIALSAETKNPLGWFALPASSETNVCNIGYRLPKLTNWPAEAAMSRTTMKMDADGFRLNIAKLSSNSDILALANRQIYTFSTVSVRGHSKSLLRLDYAEVLHLLFAWGNVMEIRSVRIGKKNVGPGNPCFIVGE